MSKSITTLFDNFNIPSPKLYTPRGDVAAFLYSKYPLIEITNKKQYESSLKLFDRLSDALSSLEGKDQKVVSRYLGQLSEKIEAYEAVEFSDLYDDMSFADVVDELLDSKGLKRKDIEVVFGDKTLVSKYLNKALDIKMGHLSGLSQILDCEVSFLAAAYVNSE